MSLKEKKYMVKGRDGTVYFMTDVELCNRVMRDSKSDKNWIASARELVRVCKNPFFSKEYALSIKVAILNCFANLEHHYNCGQKKRIYTILI